MKMCRLLKRAAGAFVLITVASLILAQAAWAERNYRDMIERIGVYLTDAVELYRNGDHESAKTNVQKAYFEVFENLEGPIRVNISAQKNFALESEFAGIRRMIIAGEPVAAIDTRVAAQMAELWALLPALEAGFQIRAEAPVDAGPTAGQGARPAADSGPPPVEPHWALTVERIGRVLERAADAYESGDSEQARQLILEAQFDGYKNSLLETAIRRHVSQSRDIEYNAEFKRIANLVRTGKPARMVRGSGAYLVQDMKRVLPGLPLVGPAKAAVAAGPVEVPDRDWQAVADQVLADMARAVALYRDDDRQAAVSLIQDTYFDVFEASGMEGAIGARDAPFVAQLEGHFNRLMGLINTGAAAEDLDQAVAAMTADFAAAVALLGAGADSPLAMFIFSLMIILREGFEAILIVTAILAYLIKTGHGDKQRVIYNGVIVALLASLVTAVLVKWVFDVSAASQEVLEGATMLVAAVVLFTISYWLISKAEAERWMAYVRDKVDRSVTSGSLATLWFVAFLAVYREGAETVLFYAALTTGADATGTAAVAVGFVVGCVLLVLLYVAMRFGALKLPIRAFFMATGGLLYLMAFVFAGKGMMELVEGKVLQPDLVSWLPEISLLGIYPYWQTAAPQALLVVAALIAFAILVRQRPRTSD